MSEAAYEPAGTGGRPEVHVVLPGDVDDPAMPTGGNTYDRRLCSGLTACGWSVREIVVAGSWPSPDGAARATLARELATLDQGAVVLLDGLVACGVPEIVAPWAARLRIVVLVHLPLAYETGQAPEVAAGRDAAERATLRAAHAVVATSRWAACRLVERHGIDPHRVHTAEPGTDPAPLARGTDGVSRLLCAAAVIPRKGQDLLIEALASVGDLPWRCVCAGSLDRDPGFHARLVRLIERHELTGRVRLAGALDSEALAAEYDIADLVVLPSRAETFGMVVTEALARGIPVLAANVDGVPEALGRDDRGGLPGMLVRSGEADGFAASLRRWFGDPHLRRALRGRARVRRGMLAGWPETVRRVREVLELVR